MKKESGHGKKDQIEFEFQNPFFGEVIALFAKYEKHQCILDFHKITFKIEILAKNPYSSTRHVDGSLLILFAMTL